MSEHFNKIRDQLRLGSCTSFASGSIFEYVYHLDTRTEKRFIDISELFLYYHSRVTYGGADPTDNVGTTFYSACKVLKEMGVCVED